MKDISGIFSKVFPTEKDGFYSVPDPLPVPSRLKPAPTGFDLPSAPALFQCEVFSPSTLSSLLKDWGIGDFSNFENYFKGGETEALNRLQQSMRGGMKVKGWFRKVVLPIENFLGDLKTVWFRAVFGMEAGELIAERSNNRPQHLIWTTVENKKGTFSFSNERMIQIHKTFQKKTDAILAVLFKLFSNYFRVKDENGKDKIH